MSQSSDQRLFLPHHASNHDSSLRSLMGASDSPYVSFHSLAEAQEDSDGVLIMEGDDGGTIYVVSPVRLVRCSQQTLERLLHDIDALIWDEPDMAHIFYERVPTGQGIAGGMRGGLATGELWVHEKLGSVAASIHAVITGAQPSLD